MKVISGVNEKTKHATFALLLRIWYGNIGNVEHLVSNSEAEWLKAALNGDDNAFACLVETYQRPVYNLCYRMLDNPQEAEDAAQETFWRAYQALRRYDAQRSFATWLLSIAAHYCIDLQRRHRAPTIDLDALPDDILPDANLPDPEKMASRSEEKRYLHQLLTNLSAQDRAAIVLRYWHEFSDEEIAQTLGLTVSAVKSRLHRARRQLASLWMESQPQTVTAERKRHESPVF